MKLVCPYCGDRFDYDVRRAGATFACNYGIDPCKCRLWINCLQNCAWSMSRKRRAKAAPELSGRRSP